MQKRPRLDHFKKQKETAPQKAIYLTTGIEPSQQPVPI